MAWAHLEPIVMVLRSGADGSGFGAPFEFSGTVVLRGDSAEIIGASGRFPIGARKLIEQELRKHGVKHVSYERRKIGEAPVTVSFDDNGRRPPIIKRSSAPSGLADWFTFTATTFVLALIAAALILLFAMSYREAHGAPPENADPALAPWFQGLKQPGTGIGCCSVADCRATEYRMTDDHYEALIDDRWIAVPDDKVLQRVDNPTGRAVVCWTPMQGVLCFVRPSES